VKWEERESKDTVRVRRRHSGESGRVATPLAATSDGDR
jgi:hypothetical protein